jgi:hypothetical protein
MVVFLRGKIRLSSFIRPLQQIPPRNREMVGGVSKTHTLIRRILSTTDDLMIAATRGPASLLPMWIQFAWIEV